MQPASPRLAPLDTLRGIAVLLVLARHAPLAGLPEWLAVPMKVIHRGGWAGVDLFFVLSGFLVSGLLFREWREHGRLRAGRFLLRRGFKIYPAFYVMLAVVLAWAAWHGRWPGWPIVLSEVFFVQNYGPSLFPHTWSLAVEEHFYLTLPLVLWLARGEKARPFASLPAVVLGVCIVCLGLRLAAAWDSDVAVRANYVPTHLRCDGLFFGALLAWLHHFHREQLAAFVAQRRTALALAAAALLAPAFALELGPVWFLHTAGFTLLYLGAGALVLLAVHSGWRRGPVAWIGFYSYSIYLWHIAVQRILLPKLLPPDAAPVLVLALYFAAAIVAGIVMAWVVELPFLRLRERLVK